MKKQMKKWTNKQINKRMNARNPHTFDIDHFLFRFWVEKKNNMIKSCHQGQTRKREKEKDTELKKL